MALTQGNLPCPASPPRPAPQVSCSRAGRAAERGARGVPARGEFLLCPGTTDAWRSGKSRGGVGVTASVDQGHGQAPDLPDRTGEFKPSRPQGRCPASTSKWSRGLQPPPPTGPRGPDSHPLHPRNPGFPMPCPQGPWNPESQSILRPDLMAVAPCKPRVPSLSEPSAMLQLCPSGTPKTPPQPITKSADRASLSPCVTSGVSWRGLRAPRAAASALRQPRCLPAEPPPGPRSPALSPASF
jgi:hypothetical protein